MTTFLAGRYDVNQEITDYDSITNVLGSPIKTFHCHDNISNQKVVLKAISFPKDPRLHDLAINIWEQDIRLSRKAISTGNGLSLLKLLDARLDQTEGLLIVVLEYYEDTLSSFIDSNSNNKLFSKEIDSRRKFWEMFLQLTQGLDALHDSGLLHRSISPKSIFLTDDEKVPLRLGNFIWGVYLHSLVQVLSKKDKILSGERIWDIYCAPEIVPYSDETRTKKGETFTSDLFALGMVITHCLLHEFPTIEPSDLRIRYELINEIREEILNSDVFILEEERELLLSLVDVNRINRPSSTKRLLELISGIINSLVKEEDFEILDKLPISFDSRPGSYFWRDLERVIDKDLAEISKKLQVFLDEEFKGCFVYPTFNKNFPLCIVSLNDICYQFRPKYSAIRGRENLTVADLKIPPFYYQEKNLKTIKSVKPIAILKEGVFITDFPYQNYSTSKWGSLFSIARSMIAESEHDPSKDVSNFIDRLFLILDAQKVLDSKNILKYRIKSSMDKKESEFEEITIENIDSEGHENSIGKLNLLDFIREIREKSSGKVELSLESSPYAEFDEARIWEVILANPRDNEITLKRKKTKRGRRAPQVGFIRPSELRLGIHLYKRKRWGIIDLKENRSLLDVLLFPRSTLFSLGLPEINEDPLVDRIQNTIPMFLVQGPPGTGKTWLASKILETILLKEPSSRILLAAHDHEPLDNLLETVIELLQNPEINKYYPPLAIRLLSPDRELEYEPDAIIRQYAPHKVTKTILSTVKSLIDQNQLTLDDDLLKIWKEEVERNIENLSFDWIDLIQRSSNIVFSSATSAKLHFLKRNAPPFDWVIIEEAGKAYITELILPMNLGQRWLLIGDQKQLPPYQHREINQIISNIIEEKENLSDSDSIELQKTKETLAGETKYFDDLYRRFESTSIFYSTDEHSRACDQLKKQWRLPPKISDMISTIFYDGILFEHEKEAPNIGDPFKKPDFIANHELIWINIPYCTTFRDAGEKILPNGGHLNNYESKIIAIILKSLIPNESNQKIDLAIITPYKDQKELLSTNLKSIETHLDHIFLPSLCFTVDSYQGRQADITIVSLVRNNDNEDIRRALGFTINEERLNVLFSRSKKRLIVVGCIEQFEIFNEESEACAINEIIQYFRTHGKIIDAKELL